MLFTPELSAILHTSAAENDIDLALQPIQEHIGVDGGDFAGEFFCGMNWSEEGPHTRMELLRQYAAREIENVRQAQAATAPQAQHAPGPWIAKRLDQHHWIIISEATGETIVHKISTLNDNQEANARLIAAAPELLAALEGAIPFLEREQREAFDYEVMPLTIARSAIAKARGQ